MPFSPPNIELEAIARQSVEASREVISAYSGNIGRSSKYFLLPTFLAVHTIGHSILCMGQDEVQECTVESPVEEVTIQSSILYNTTDTKQSTRPAKSEKFPTTSISRIEISPKRA